MKNFGYWEKKDRTVRSHGWINNIDSFACDKDNGLEKITAEECRCRGCIEKGMQNVI